MSLSLRPVADSDLDVLFDMERDPVAVRMAAFTPADPDDRDAFDRHWARIRSNPEVLCRIITDGEAVVGSIATFVMEGDREVTYWVDRAHWGQGVATAALALLLAEDRRRPLFARAVDDNLGSLRVLRKAGFVEIGDNVDFAPGRGTEVRELILRLDA